jgi:hypothetical protein
MSLPVLITYLLMLVSLSTLIVGLICSKYFKQSLKYLLFLVVISNISDVVSLVFAFERINNSLIINLYSVVEIVFYILIYWKSFDSDRPNWTILTACLLTFMAVVAELIWGDVLVEPSNILMVNSSFSILLMSLFWYYTELKEIKYENILREPFFWVNSASLIYFASSLFLFLFSNYIFAISIVRLWTIHNVLHIIYFILITTGFWTQRRLQK